MKTSRIIFISFFSFLGLILLSLMVMGFMYKDKDIRKFKEKDIKTVNITLDSFSHIVVSDNCRVNLSSNTSYSVSYSLLKGTVNKPVYNINNDTLFIKSTKTNFTSSINVKANNIISVSGVNCKITLDKFKQEALSFDVKKTEIRFYKNVNIQNLDITLSESSWLNGWSSFKAQNLKLNTSNSKFQGSINGKLKSFDANITKNSEVRLLKALHYNLNVDSSSSVKLY